MNIAILVFAALLCAGCGRTRCAPSDKLRDHTGQKIGFERCRDGAPNRVRPVDIPDRDHWAAQLDLCIEPDGCNAGCGDEPHEYCIESGGEFGGCSCVQLCESDDDCNDGQICLHPKVWTADWPSCVAADCERNSDCLSGECGVARGSNSCGSNNAKLRCRSHKDECRDEWDCRNANEGQDCWADNDGFYCTNEIAYACD